MEPLYTVGIGEMPISFPLSGTFSPGDSPRTVRRRMRERERATGNRATFGHRRSYVMWDFLAVDDDFEVGRSGCFAKEI